ncbi:response regulator transcription factor [Sediminitomix flava]|uniref:LuxR family two component transcriptional regulator n=1 Tax=Sediminitomix flava TaxID=379075 RepID=A0A315ZDE1_SEDFL|nr:response regulator transcription factor [Sediminitomix flava]PWJ42878.1 LuxR family two component transcriptional regulator [Sediminitomix flava]
MNKINILLTDDHVIVRNGIKMLLENEKDIEVIDEASNGLESIAKYKELKPDIIVMDIQMPQMNGIEATTELKRLNPDVKILILSMHDDEEYILDAVNKGAMGYVLKDAGNEEFLRAIHTINNGGKYFSGAVSNVLVNKYLSQQGEDFLSKKVVKPSTPQKHIDLTKREKEILSYVVDGLSSKDIAQEIGKSVRTVEAHRFNIMKKLEVKSAVELVRKVSEEPELYNLLISK